MISDGAKGRPLEGKRTASSISAQGWGRIHVDANPVVDHDAGSFRVRHGTFDWTGGCFLLGQ